MQDCQDTLPANDAIIGVEFKVLKTWRDDRGFFREVIRFNDPIFQDATFAQWSHSKMKKDVVKAWHYHHVQYDWWYVPLGQIITTLYDNRPESPTYRTKLVFRMGDPEEFGPGTHEICVRIPQGVLHGCRVMSEQAHLFYITSETYNPDDEGRFPFDSDVVPHCWGDKPLVADNDRRTFVPKTPRRIVG